MDQDASIPAYSEALLHAVHKHNLKLAKELLEAGATVNAPANERYDENGERLVAPIIEAIFWEDLKMLELLLEFNPNVNDENANGGHLPLVLAAYLGDLETVRTLLACPGIIVNARNSNGWFALLEAAGEGHYDIVKLLVNHGGHRSKEEFTEALGKAACKGHLGIMSFLIEHGADANHYSVYNDITPPLVNVLAFGDWWKNKESSCCLDALRLLIRRGASLADAFDYLNSDEDSGLWFFEKNQTIFTFKQLAQEQERAGSLEDNDVKWALSYWNAVVAAVWFLYFGLDHATLPPSIQETARLSDEEFKKAYKWMVHAVASLQFLYEGPNLLDQLCEIFDSNTALEPSDRTGKTPLLLAIEAFSMPQRDGHVQLPCWPDLNVDFSWSEAESGVTRLIEWNPEALKIPHPETQRSPMTCAIVNRVCLWTLKEMITCKNEKWFTSLPLQQDPVTSLPNFLLIATSEDEWRYSVSDIYEFSRDFLPEIIASTLNTPPGKVSRRGIKRRRDQIGP